MLIDDDIISAIANQVLGDQASAFVGKLINFGRKEAAKSYGVRLAQFSAILDDDTCPLCEELDGMVVSTDSVEYEMYTPRIHNNCRCIWVYIDPEEENPPEEDFEPPTSDLVARYGNLVLQSIAAKSLIKQTAKKTLKRIVDDIDDEFED